MNNQHKIISGVIAILFVVVVQWFSNPLPIFRFLIPSFLLYLGTVMVYTRWYLKSQDNYSLWTWLRLPIFMGSWFWILFLVPSGLGRGVFLLGSVLLIYFLTNTVGNRGQQLAWNQYLITIFGILIAIAGFSFYFESIHGLVYLASLFVLITLATRASIEQVPHSQSIKWLVSLVIALFAVELYWVSQFLPLHYTILAIIQFNILYLLWVIYYHYLYQTLNQKQIQFNLALVLALSIVVLLTTPWSIQA